MGAELGPKATGQESYEGDEILTTEEMLQQLGPDVQAAYAKLQDSRPSEPEVEE